MQFILIAILSFLFLPLAAGLVGTMLYALVQNPMMWFVMVGGILCVARLGS